MYVKLFPRDLNSTFTSTLHKHLYLWSDHHIKGVQWCSCIIFIIWESSSCIKLVFGYASVYVFAGVWHFVWVLYSVHGTYKPLFFSKTFIKNGSHGTIQTFKNYFAIVFSIFNNKRYSNRP